MRAGLVEPRVNEQARKELLQLQFSTGRGTLYDGIKRVLPGETLVVVRGQGGRAPSPRRRCPTAARSTGRRTRRSARARRASLEDSVRMHQRSDVPYGMFLSGGIDSAALLTLMARLNTRPVLAYTAGFENAGAMDEREQARKVAQALGAEHIEVRIHRDGFLAAAAARSPRRWTIPPPTTPCCRPTSWRASAKKDVKVVLSRRGRRRDVRRLRPLPQRRRARGGCGGRTVRARGAFDGLGVLRTDLAGWRDGIAAAEATESKRRPLARADRPGDRFRRLAAATTC